MKKISLKQRLALFLFLFLGFIAFQEHSAGILLKGVLAAVAAVSIDAGFIWRRDRKVRLPDSAIITGLLTGFVLSADGPWWSTPAAAAVAVLSKHVLRVKGRHIFNPAAFGAFAALFFFGGATQWYGAYDWYLVIPFGLYFASSINRLPVVAAYYLTAAALYAGQSILQGGLQMGPFVDAIHYLNHFFVFIMLIEPKTSPYARIEMISFGALASALCFGLSFVALPLSAELPVLLGVNLLFVFYRSGRGKK